MASGDVDGRTVLVTGGAGFVGSHLVDALAPRNDVRVLDDLSTGRRSRVHDDATLLESDLTDPDAVSRAMRGVDLVFHQAAIVSVQRSVEHPTETHEVNLDASLALLERAREEDARVVVASSAAIYGQPERLPISEDDRPAPTSPYGVQKLALDQYARVYHDHYGLETVVLRYFNVYGPRQHGSYSGVLSTFLDQAARGDPLTIEGDGAQSRDFVHVDDVVRANLLAATADVVGKAFNVGTGRRTTVTELASTVRSTSETHPPIVHRDPRPGDIRHSCADVTKARHQLGFEPSVDVDEGVRSLVERRMQRVR